ncbi:MAG: MoaD/ThiS family protein [Thermoprotei archaeon]
MKIRLFGSLASVREITIDLDGDTTLLDLLQFLRQKYEIKSLLLDDNRIRPDILILINGKDYRLEAGSRSKVTNKDEVTIIPINHGG